MRMEDGLRKDRHIQRRDRVKQTAPNGTPVRVMCRITFEQTPRERQRWPFCDMVPGDAVEIVAPSEFCAVAAGSATSYKRKDGSVILKAKRHPVRPDGKQLVFVWCEAIKD